MTGSIRSTVPWFVPTHRPLGQRGAHSEASGRSRGGFTSKIHARCDNQRRPLGFVLTGGEVSDYKATDVLRKLPAPRPKAMLADQGYDSDSFRQNLPQCSTENRLAALQRSQPCRTDVQPPQADAPHRDPIRQDCPVLHQLPQPRRRKVLGQVFCQHAPGSGFYLYRNSRERSSCQSRTPQNFTTRGPQETSH